MGGKGRREECEGGGERQKKRERRVGGMGSGVGREGKGETEIE